MMTFTRSRDSLAAIAMAVLFCFVVLGCGLSPALAKSTKPTTKKSDLQRALEQAKKMAAAIKRNTLVPYLIGPGDILEVIVWREEAVSRSELLVRPDGKITMALIDDIQAAGRTPMQLKAALTEAFKKYLTAPQVYVTLKASEANWFSVLGNVNEPGRHHMLAPTTVLQAIAQAKGFNEWASKNNVVIIRGTPPNQQRFEFDYSEVIDGDNIEQNIRLWPGDVIIVP